MLRIEQVSAHDLVLSDFGDNSWSRVEAKWPVFIVAVAILVYSLGLIGLLAVDYLFPFPGVHVWANHEYHTFYGMVLNSLLLVAGFIFFTYMTRVPFARTLLGLAFVELIN